MKISVLIPTYLRQHQLKLCLESLRHQTFKADEIIVVFRDTDHMTKEFLNTVDKKSLPVRSICVTVPGQVASLNAGLEAATGDIIAITDDDAVPHSHWLAIIHKHFLLDPTVGGVGGRDWLYNKGILQDEKNHPGSSNIVGKLKWYGRVSANHHIGYGEPREVDILKGVNMSYRAIAIKNIRFDSRLRGAGAQVDNDLLFSLTVSRSGWRLIYDPEVSLDHYLGERFSEDKRDEFNSKSWIDSSYNNTLSILINTNHIQSVIFIIWSFLVGTRQNYGLIQLFRMIPLEGLLSIQKTYCSFIGKYEAVLDLATRDTT
jgi:glycosyltransferase involved in cell wall biosynthesis